MNALTGKNIIGLSVSDDQHYLSFQTNAGPITFIVEGDCCSESWFADITGVNALIGGTVNGVEIVSMEGYNVDDGRGRQEEDAVYGYKILTDKGYADIVFRNSSNGYYGGWLEEFSGDAPANMMPITADWSA